MDTKSNNWALVEAIWKGWSKNVQASVVLAGIVGVVALLITFLVAVGPIGLVPIFGLILWSLIRSIIEIG